ncbi:hypothetical protein PAXRUDRAFT_825130 [Paxillus rubicundulus Ve08.2h10]|uniref:Uncharacterized protein n=1 Tax=Paxillus rubicundulus Ve08.2h10 TaxID=930991 RepID=A0A0D0E6R5_9AGAM|nr:hypothetical protein PAXRUDRAFT_825130 [Paxillus rubicundulus Ve08.2h10]
MVGMQTTAPVDHLPKMHTLTALCQCTHLGSHYLSPMNSQSSKALGWREPPVQNNGVDDGHKQLKTSYMTRNVSPKGKTWFQHVDGDRRRSVSHCPCMSKTNLVEFNA